MSIIANLFNLQNIGYKYHIVETIALIYRTFVTLKKSF